MIERLALRASDAAASSGDPFAAVNPDIIVGPMVRTHSDRQRHHTEYHH
jgi:hypothetical protein